MVPGKAVPPRPNYDYFVRKVIDSRIQTAVCGVPECGDSETLNYGKAVPSLVLGTKSGQNVQMVHMITLVHSCVYLPGTSASQIIKCHVCDPRREHASELPLHFSLHRISATVCGLHVDSARPSIICRTHASVYEPSGPRACVLHELELMDDRPLGACLAF